MARRDSAASCVIRSVVQDRIGNKPEVRVKSKEAGAKAQRFLAVINFLHQARQPGRGKRKVVGTFLAGIRRVAQDLKER